MDYIFFFERIKKADDRTVYRIVKEQKRIIDNNIPEFYKMVDPINVEFEYLNGIVRLIPFNELASINQEYKIDAGKYIFATCNGEPIYMKNKKVYTCICGKEKVYEEKIAESVDSFFEDVNRCL